LELVEHLDDRRRSGVAQYLTIAETIRGWIESGRYQVGDTIASIDELSTEFGVARGTIQEALRELSDRAIIISSRGRRSRVSKLPEIRPIAGPMNAADALLIEQVGELPANLVSFRILTPPPFLADLFGGKKTQLLHLYTSRLRLNDRINGISKVFMPGGTLKNPEPELSTAALRPAFRKMIDKSKRSERRVGAVTADIELSQLLGVSVGTPLLHYRVAMWLGGSKCTLYYENFLRCDGYEYKLDA